MVVFRGFYGLDNSQHLSVFLVLVDGFVFSSVQSSQSPLTLHAQLTITLKKEDNDPEKNQANEYCYAGGLVEYVKWLNTDKVWPISSS